jgi:hypothetical protein
MNGVREFVCQFTKHIVWLSLMIIARQALTEWIRGVANDISMVAAVLPGQIFSPTLSFLLTSYFLTLT